MSYDLEKVKPVRRAFTMVELYLDKNDPALDATFALQADSYGTPKTTDNAAAYTGVDFRVYRYADQNIFGVDHFIGLDSNGTISNPPTIDPGNSIGFRATGRISLIDFVDGDQYALPAPYNDSRRITGSHALKLIARNHLINRKARIIRGYNPDNYVEADAQIESYIIDSYIPPNEQGKWTINVVDELILTESKKSMAPEVSKGELSADINDTQTTLAFTSSITNEYGAVSSTGHIVIEKEVMSYTVATSTTMTIVRGVRSDAKEHKTGETLQKCIVFDNVNIIDIITQLITDYTKIPASYIPTTDWAALKAGDLANYNLTNIIFKPESVNKHLNSLIKLAGLSMYVDVINQELVIVTTPDFAEPVITLDETEHLIQSKTVAKPNPKKQITRQTIHWNKVNITESDKEENYSKHFQVIDAKSEEDAGESVVSEPKPLFSNWIINTLEDNSLATSYVNRNINRFSATPTQVTGTIDQRYVGNVAGGRMWLGAIFDINTSKIPDRALNNVTTTCQCISLKPSRNDNQWDFVGLSYIAAAPVTADLYISVDKVDYLLTDELTTTEAREYVVVINTNVTISSSSALIKSFNQGAFFAGATLKLVILGRILGAGGAGGTGGDAASSGAVPPTICSVVTSGNGSDGGDALNLTTDTIIDNGFGFIGGGGGGGAGNAGECNTEFSFVFAVGGAGGGGGQGKIGGAGGSPGVGDPSNGGTGIPGNEAAPGDNGGEFGAAGGDVGAATGGAAGVAIQKNGNTVTITAGNNSEQIKGVII